MGDGRLEPKDEGSPESTAEELLASMRERLAFLTGAALGGLSSEQRAELDRIESERSALERVLLPNARKRPSGLLAPVASPGPCRILLADDDSELLDLLGTLLGARHSVTPVGTGAEALSALRSQDFHLAIVDLDLPVVDGFAVAQVIRASRGASPAFMFLSAHGSAEAKVRGLELGASDYVTKPFDPDELVARVDRVLASVAREASLRADALTDSLTGVFNYRALLESLERELERARRYREPLSLLTIDLDHLKRINDERGHLTGDRAISCVAAILKAAIRRFEIVARRGGDEFAVMLPNTAARDALQLAERLRSKVAATRWQDVTLSVSIGVGTQQPGERLSVEELMEKSDRALYEAKRLGRNRVVGGAG